MSCRQQQSLLLVIFVIVAARRVHAHSVPDGFTLQPLAFVTDPHGIVVAASGEVYVGRNNAGSGGSEFDFVHIHRISAGGTRVVEIGDETLPDPGAVTLDTLGLFTGEPGAILVSGRAPEGGYVAAILPDDSVIPVFGPTDDFMNASDLIVDANGRLLLADGETNQVLVSEGDDDAPHTLFTLPAAPTGITIDAAGLIYTGAADGVIRVHQPDGTLVDDAFATGLGPLINLAAGPGGSVWGTDLYVISDLKFWRIDLQGNTAELAAGYEPGDLSFGPDGALYNAFFEEDIVLRMAPVPGNLNGDGEVGPADLAILLGSWGFCPAKQLCEPDLDHDGAVGPADLAILLGNWG